MHRLYISEYFVNTNKTSYKQTEIGYGSLTVNINVYKNGNIDYTIAQFWCSYDYNNRITQESSSLNLYDKFDQDIFRDNIEEMYYEVDDENIDSDVLNCIVKTMVDRINDTRREHTVAATIWVGQQIRREWKDLLPYVATMLDAHDEK